MYAFCRPIFGFPASLLAAAFYVVAPYHVFDLYQRTALSEFWSFAWMPLFLDAGRRVVLGSVYAGVDSLASEIVDRSHRLPRASAQG